jgi:hypothetical protein
VLGASKSRGMVAVMYIDGTGINGHILAHPEQILCAHRAMTEFGIRESSVKKKTPFVVEIIRLGEGYKVNIFRRIDPKDPPINSVSAVYTCDERGAILNRRFEK